MGKYQSTAIINLQVNGRQAGQILDQMKQKADNLSKAIAKEKISPNPNVEKIKHLERELREANNLINQMSSRTDSAERALARLDKASPRELQKLLRQLKADLNNIERGSKAWDAQAEKIRRVQAELNRVNQSAQPQQSFWRRMAQNVNDFSEMVTAGAAAITGLVLAGRAAVNQFAEMDEEMANTRKFTGMTKEGVEDLNNVFKAMDTRTTRETLNQLAQEAGRLGKTTKEDIMGYVRASDILNVALVDLGEGATQSIAKLSNIFKIEDQYGTYDSMVKIGSVVNVLSQNCTASKPYLVEFANRLAGVGNQANLSIQNIIAFGAVLDANAQKVESSATAVGQVLTRMYRDPAKYARVAGMDVSKFTDLLKKDANEALLQFLETLNKAGNLDTLAPMFADMGENGSRVITALSTLAKHIDEVRSQQTVANKAFEEGTSVLNEYNIFNSTTQAGIEKAKKAFSEMAVELGEKLVPVMRHVITSSSAVMRALSYITTFISDNIGVIGRLTLAIVAYTVAVKAELIWSKKAALVKLYESAVRKKNLILTNAETAARHAGAAAWALLTGNIGKATAAMKAFNTVSKTSLIGILVSLVALLSAKFLMASDAVKDFRKKMDDASKSIEDATAKGMKEQKQLDDMMATLKGCSKESDRYKDAKNKIISQYGRYLRGLMDERGEITNLSLAYDRLTAAIRRSARERGIAAAQEQMDKDFMATVSSDIYQLELSLKKFGADAATAKGIVEKVQEAIVAGRKVDGKTAAIIARYADNGQQVLDDGSKTNAAQRFVWSNIYNFGADSPLEILNRISDVSSEYESRSKQNKKAKESLSPFPNVDTKVLLSQEERLKAIAASGRKGSVYLPENLVTPDMARTDRAKGVPLVISPGEYAKATGATAQTGKSDKTKSVIPGVEIPAGFPEVSDKIQPGLPPMKNGPMKVGNDIEVTITPEMAKRLLEPISREIGYRSGSDANKGEPDETEGEDYSAHSSSGSGGSGSKGEDPMKRDLDQVKKRMELEKTQADTLYAISEITSEEHFERMKSIRDRYYEDSLAVYRRYGQDQSLEARKMMLEQRKDETDYLNAVRATQIKFIEESARLREKDIDHAYEMSPEKGFIEEMERDARKRASKLLEIQEKLRTFGDLGEGEVFAERSADLYTKNKEFKALVDERDRLIREDDMARAEKMARKAQEFAKKYATEDKAEQLRRALEIIKFLRDNDAMSEDDFNTAERGLKGDFFKDTAPDDNDTAHKIKELSDKMRELKKAYEDGSISADEYNKKIAELKRQLRDLKLAPLDVAGDWGKSIRGVYSAWADMIDAIKNKSDDLPLKMGEVIATTAGVIAAGMQSVTEFTEAEAKIQEERLQKRYDREISYAEGNQYKIRKLEKKKERELAEIRRKQSEKNFVLQVIQTVAATAQNAVLAYKAGLEIGGPAGLIMAPIAAALAVAQGAVQIALIKKQQSAASAGYAEGGFTPEGDRLKPVGVVHAGEWVASQKLTRDRRIRPVIEALEYMQRNNIRPSITADTVSTGIVATARPRQEASMPQPDSTGIIQNSTLNQALSDTVARLADRLDKPFVTVNSVTGDLGMKQANDKYNRLLANASRPNRSRK